MSPSEIRDNLVAPVFPTHFIPLVSSLPFSSLSSASTLFSRNRYCMAIAKTGLRDCMRMVMRFSKRSSPNFFQTRAFTRDEMNDVSEYSDWFFSRVKKLVCGYRCSIMLDLYLHFRTQWFDQLGIV
jgi:hypothetical protein